MTRAVILAGGKGARLGKLTQNIPKAMVKIGAIPLLEHQINLLKRYGIKDILVLTGHLSEVIENFVKNKDFGIKVKCLKSAPEIGNADRVKLAKKYLGEDFFVLYCDTMLDMDLKRLIDFHKNKKSLATLVLHPNDHPYDSDLVETDENKKIVAFHSKPHRQDEYLKNLVNAGVYVMSPKIFNYIKSKKGTELDFGRDIFPGLIKKENIFGYNTPEYIKDMGTVERLKKVTADHLSGKVNRLNLKNKRRAIFLDRDGTINPQFEGDLREINKFFLLPGVTKAVKMINLSDYLAIVVTNQPVIAKGFSKIKEVEQIHKKMESLLGQEGAKLDAIYYCPHHPERGYPGENRKYTIPCDCRKPLPGMLKKAEKEFNIDLRNSWLVGDGERDILAGFNAGVKTILIRNNKGEFAKCRVKTRTSQNLCSAVKFILNQKK